MIETNDGDRQEREIFYSLILLSYNLRFYIVTELFTWSPFRHSAISGLMPIPSSLIDLHALEAHHTLWVWSVTQNLCKFIQKVNDEIINFNFPNNHKK